MSVSSINPHDVMNGTIWKAEWPACWDVVVQWVDGDKWIVLTVPYKSIFGGTAMQAVDHGSIIKTHAEVCDLLQRWKATRMLNYRLECV